MEAERPVMPWWARVSTSIRRSLNRGLGPPQRGLELPISLLKKETEELLGFAGIRHQRASYSLPKVG